MEQRPIEVEDLWSDGNAFSILGKCQRAARKAGWSTEQWGKVRDEAMAGDYDHLLQTVMKHFQQKDNEFDESDEGDHDE